MTDIVSDADMQPLLEAGRIDGQMREYLFDLLQKSDRYRPITREQCDRDLKPYSAAFCAMLEQWLAQAPPPPSADQTPGGDEVDLSALQKHSVRMVCLPSILTQLEQEYSRLLRADPSATVGQAVENLLSYYDTFDDPKNRTDWIRIFVASEGYKNEEEAEQAFRRFLEGRDTLVREWYGMVCNRVETTRLRDHLRTLNHRLKLENNKLSDIKDNAPKAAAVYREIHQLQRQIKAVRRAMWVRRSEEYDEPFPPDRIPLFRDDIVFCCEYLEQTFCPDLGQEDD